MSQASLAQRASLPKGSAYPIVVANCNSHVVRKFRELGNTFPDAAAFFEQAYAQVFRNDAHARIENLSSSARLAYHREHSLPLMEAMQKRAQRDLSDRLLEDNSTLGKAYRYFLNHYARCVAFCEVNYTAFGSGCLSSLEFHYQVRRGSPPRTSLPQQLNRIQTRKLGAHRFRRAKPGFLRFVGMTRPNHPWRWGLLNPSKAGSYSHSKVHTKGYQQGIWASKQSPFLYLYSTVPSRHVILQTADAIAVCAKNELIKIELSKANFFILNLG